MYNLKTTPILTDWQKTVLTEFFASPLTKQFYLTGGTALSAFYFGHRESKDLDFFCSEPFEMARIQELLQTIGKSLNASYSEKVSTQTYKEVYLTHNDWVQRIDIVREQPVHFGEIQVIDGIRVDSLENIGANKMTAIFGRLEPKDFVDLYMILHRSTWAFDVLLALAQKKDAGLEPFMFSYALDNAGKITSWPKLPAPITPESIIRYFRMQALNMLKRIKPEK